MTLAGPGMLHHRAHAAVLARKLRPHVDVVTERVEDALAEALLSEGDHT